MKFGSVVLASSSAINLTKQKEILAYINNHPEKQAELAKKEYNRFNIITLLIILSAILLICFCTVFSLNKSRGGFDYPNGSVKEVSGHISLYENTFWYTDSSKKYVFDFNDYNIDESYTPGENIRVYLDDNNNVVAVTHITEDRGVVVNIILMLAVPVVLILLHAFVGRKTYAKNWNLYVKWYEKEIQPYLHQHNFEEITAGKHYYNVITDIKDLSVEQQKSYKKYRNKSVLYLLLLLACIALTIYFCIKFDLNPYNWLIECIIIAYVIVFYVLINNCDVEMHRIKTGFYGKNDKKQILQIK